MAPLTFTRAVCREGGGYARGRGARGWVGGCKQRGLGDVATSALPSGVCVFTGLRMAFEGGENEPQQQSYTITNIAAFINSS